MEIVRRAYALWEPAWGSGTTDLGELLALALMDDGLVCRTHGKVVRSRTYTDQGEALEAADLGG